MADSHSGDPPGTEGLRRRHSAPRDDLDAYVGTVDAATPPPRRSLHHERVPRVQFSSDTERIQPEAQGKHGRTEPGATAALTPTIPPVSSRQPSDQSGLSLDTTEAISLIVASQNAVESPPTPRLTSPLEPTGGLPPCPRPSRSWGRGYSLRSAILNRNMVEQVDGDGSLIELGSVGSSTQQAWHFQKAAKQSLDTIVAVSPSYEEETPQRLRNKTGEIPRTPFLPHYEQWLRQRAARSKFSRRLKLAYKRARKFVLRISVLAPTKDGRHIDVDATRKFSLNDERTGKPYVSNIIRSSRYNAWNFLPLQLCFQFSKIANFYFLCVSILQMIPGLSTTGTYTTIVPLLFFVGISMAKEGYDDFRRRKLDKEENDRETSVLHAYQPAESGARTASDPSSLGPIHWATTKWKDVQVGDIVKLKRDQAAPADLILLHSHGENGIAYIETMALDGETNLKSKLAAPCLSRTCDTTDKLATSNAHLVVEDPNLDLYSFHGKVIADGETSPLSNGEVVYRGSVLRNTTEAVGVVVYSGEECKIRMNASQNPRIKAPSLQKIVNRIVVLIVVFVVALAIFNTIAYEIWKAQNESSAWYLYQASVSFVEIFVSYVIMFNTMVPLSLYVSLEIIKAFQMVLLNDMDMYDEVSDTPMEARTSTINEELGQINYIFSDKTGTLTDNMMKFRKISVAGTAWLHDSDLKAAATGEGKIQRLPHRKRSKGKRPARRGRFSESHDSMARTSSGILSSIGPASPVAEDSTTSPRWKSSARSTKAQPELQTLEMLQYIQRRPNTVFASKARFFLLSIALCHTCLPETKEDGSIGFQAASPDELALVQAAQELGYMVTDRRLGIITIKTFPQGLNTEPQFERYEVLDVIEFSSKRKRMSIVVKFPDQRICVISKGADSIMTQLLRLSAFAIQKTVEIERRANRRKSMEASQIIARKSEHHERSPSLGQSNISLPHKSVGTRGRPSLVLSFDQPLRNQVNDWLKQRENEVDASVVDHSNLAYDPRPSFHLGRPSLAPSDYRSSLQDDADYELVEEALVNDESAVIERCFQHINDFATQGLRTLLYGYRFLEGQEYMAWRKVYREATTSLVDRQIMIEKAGELIEKDLELAGATAIEDKLQKGVPDAIDKLRRANIKMWMLTGDKRETAINISHSCRLIKDYSSVTVLDHEMGNVEQLIATALVNINKGTVAHSVVVIDGQTLSQIEADDFLKALFYDLAIVTDSVICCRASPSQKAGLVKAIRHKVKKSITLAIGDGANDIAMIQEAHVGIGITGKEGLQAARTSDYSIAQFRFLTKLLLVHGRWNYMRICKYTVATFWKEMMFYLTQALYQRYVGYTGTSLYENWSLSMFNTLFTSLPVIFLGIFEQDLAPSTLLAVPELYTKGQRNGGFNLKLYLWWSFTAATEALLIFYCMHNLFATSPATSSTPNTDLFPMGDLCFTAVVLLVATKLQLLEVHNRSAANAVAWLLSVGGWFLWNAILGAIYKGAWPYDVRDGFLERFGRDPRWWLTLFATLAAVLGFEVAVKALKAGLWPSDTDTFKMLEKDGPIRERFEEAARAELEMGWAARNEEGRSRLEGARGEAGAEAEEAGRQAEREGEIAELLRRRGASEQMATSGGSPRTGLSGSTGFAQTGLGMRQLDDAAAGRSGSRSSLAKGPALNITEVG